MTPVTATACPTWCDPACCTHDAIDVVRHRSTPVAWNPDENAEVTLRRVWVDEPGSTPEIELTVRDLYGDEVEEVTTMLDEPNAVSLHTALGQLLGLAAG